MRNGLPADAEEFSEGRIAAYDPDGFGECFIAHSSRVSFTSEYVKYYFHCGAEAERYALRNVGESMNKECADGGYWVFVRLEDLTGIGPRPGDFVIVQRSRYAGQEFEATCKRLEIREGKPWLCPYSYDPSFEPIPFTGLKSDEIQVIGIVTDVINRPGRRR